MASRSRKSGGGGGFLSKFLWAIGVGAVIVFFFTIPYDPGASGIIAVVQAKAKTVENWVKTSGIVTLIENLSHGVIVGGDDTYNGQAGPQGQEPGTNVTNQTKQQLILALNLISITEPENVSYNRDEYSHWNNVRPCWTVREQVLFEEAVAGTIILLDGDGAVVEDVNRACEIKSGTWIDPYTGKEFNSPSDLDIDHTIPLAYANSHGASWWDKEKKASYANDLTYPGTLVAVSKSANRSKGAKGPSDWKPSNEGYWCQYATDWINVSTEWTLSISKADNEALLGMLDKCEL